MTSKTSDIVVVLDPGHDSKHAGSRGNGVKEEVVTLKIAKYCKEELDQYKGIKVYFTRNDEDCPFPESLTLLLYYFLKKLLHSLRLIQLKLTLELEKL